MYRIFTFIFLFLGALTFAQVQTPSEFLGYELGTQFSRHADVVHYFEHIAKNSDQVRYQDYGKTNERRRLTYAIVSSPQNLANIETIRTNNLKQTGILEGSANPEIAIVWLSYNVHGNESSATESAMSTLYQLITKKQAWLENTVVIIDPCINPDGRDRYVNWYNQVKASPYNPLQMAAEHHEPWPGGRLNHYLFDLNRDWAWATQIETQERLKIYNQWMPHIHVDFHEQGINEPYYFAPAAEPFHKIITPWQREFQTQIGKNHARYFDQEGWLFFTRQYFDLLYPSYGDTYPTFMGAIGMTYEQAGHGRAGLGINTDEGYELTLKDRIAHHTTTGLSTVEIASKNASKLNREFKQFFQNDGLTYKSFVLKGNPDKLNAVTQLLDKHEIKYGTISNGSINGFNYTTGNKGSMNANGALVVSTNQPKGKMVSVLFEPNAELDEPLTYDITAWSIPYAYGLECVASTSLITASSSYFKSQVVNQIAPATSIAGYIVRWNSMEDAKFLSKLLQQGIRIRFSERTLQFNGNSYPAGSLVITKSDNRNNDMFTEIVTKTANTFGRTLHTTNTSFSDNGIDFGSSSIKLVPKNRIGMLTGDGVSSLNYGALWHFMEQELGYPVTSINTSYYNASLLDNIDVLVVPSGWYGRSLGSNFDDLKSWIRNGGKVVVFGSALSLFADKDGFDLKRKEGDDPSEDGESNLTPYDQRERASVPNLNFGSVYEVTMDPSHPLAFGYPDTYYSLKRGSSAYSYLENDFNVGYIAGTANVVSGFSGDNAQANLENTLVFGEDKYGSGSVVYLVDDVLFRSFWENGKLLFVNSLFFVDVN